MVLFGKRARWDPHPALHIGIDRLPPMRTLDYIKSVLICQGVSLSLRIFSYLHRNYSLFRFVLGIFCTLAWIYSKPAAALIQGPPPHFYFPEDSGKSYATHYIIMKAFLKTGVYRTSAADSSASSQTSSASDSDTSSMSFSASSSASSLSASASMASSNAPSASTSSSSKSS